MATMVKSFALQGIDGYVVDIQTKILEGNPSISVIGMGDQAICLLQQSEDIAAKDIEQYGFIGELSLDGSLRECKEKLGSQLVNNP